MVVKRRYSSLLFLWVFLRQPYLQDATYHMQSVFRVPVTADVFATGSTRGFISLSVRHKRLVCGG